jgi:peptidoglycan-associated lipoprotein
MIRRSLLIFFIVGSLALVLGACSKKQTVKPMQEPAVEEVQKTPPPPVEVDESATKTKEVPEMKMPVLEDVFFDFDKSDLRTDAQRTLEANAKQLKDASSATITIEGHCDERGTNAYNMALGERRANATRDYLKSLGVDASRIKTISYGEERPFDPGHNESAWAKNRRAHFVINQ